MSEYDNDQQRIPKIVDLLRFFDDGKPFVPSPTQIKNPVQHTIMSTLLTRAAVNLLLDQYTGTHVKLTKDEIFGAIPGRTNEKPHAWDWIKMMQALRQAGWVVNWREDCYDEVDHYRFSKSLWS